MASFTAKDESAVFGFRRFIPILLCKVLWVEPPEFLPRAFHAAKSFLWCLRVLCHPALDKPGSAHYNIDR